jgi:hypothetical protein
MSGQVRLAKFERRIGLEIEYWVVESKWRRESVVGLTEGGW